MAIVSGKNLAMLRIGKRIWTVWPGYIAAKVYNEQLVWPIWTRKISSMLVFDDWRLPV